MPWDNGGSAVILAARGEWLVSSWPASPGAYLFCHRVTGINARRERAIICICLPLPLSAVAHFAVRRIGDVVVVVEREVFAPSIERGDRSYDEPQVSRRGNEIPRRRKMRFLYRNGSTATTNGWYRARVRLVNSLRERTPRRRSV